MGVQSKSPKNPFVSLVKTVCLASLLVCCIASTSRAEHLSDSIRSRPELGRARLTLIAEQLRKITGWSKLDFDGDGILRPGMAAPSGGSPTARNLLASAMGGKTMLVFEDASGREEVVFCDVAEARWKTPAPDDPRVYLIRVDFSDFSHVTGDRAALEAFNVGWGVLHEIEHVVNDSDDPRRKHDLGACETLLNQMRRECGLAERAEYFYSYFPGADKGGVMTKLVRLAFDKLEAGKRRRHWVVWDANIVGGVGGNVTLASSR